MIFDSALFIYNNNIILQDFFIDNNDICYMATRLVLKSVIAVIRYLVNIYKDTSESCCRGFISYIIRTGE